MPGAPHVNESRNETQQFLFRSDVEEAGVVQQQFDFDFHEVSHVGDTV